MWKEGKEGRKHVTALISGELFGVELCGVEWTAHSWHISNLGLLLGLITVLNK